MNKNSELFIRDLGDGLILRRASKDDADALADINSRMHSDDGPDKPHAGIRAWIMDLVTKPHPTLAPSDFTIVEESATGRIVSTLCLIPQTWIYEGIEFGVGRPELVCTLPEFRRRRLVRIQMEEVHKWSGERGHLMQIITGIPYFYRQFGYDMALNFTGRRNGFEPQVPALKEGAGEPFIIREARDDDVDFILHTYEMSESRQALSCKRTPEIIRYEIFGQNKKNLNHFQKMVIENLKGERVGFFEHSTDLWLDAATCIYFAVTEGTSWFEVSPSVVRYLWKVGGEYAKRDGGKRGSFGFALGEHHPVYEVLDDKLPAKRNPYAFYVRVPDISAFLERVKPALEKRLADSVAAGYTGDLRLSFYNSGIHIKFEHGNITAIETMKIEDDTEIDAYFPDLTFLHLLMGHRSFDELRHAFTDCYPQNNAARVLLKSLFPKRLSDVYPIN